MRDFGAGIPTASTTTQPPPAQLHSPAQSLASMSEEKGITVLFRRVEILSLTEIDLINQNFLCQLFMQFRIAGGAKNEALCADRYNAITDEPVWPVGPDGKPTFKPGIRWYLDRINFTNAMDRPEKLEAAVLDSGEDLIVNMRWVGRFTEAYELENFPFDSQALHIHMVAHTRLNGPMPMRMQHDSNMVRLVDPRNTFALHQQWCLVDALGVVAGQSDQFKSQADRDFATASISCFVTRRPGFVLANVVYPSGLISLLAATLPFTVEPIPANASGRLDATVVFILTMVAFKTSIASALPAIAYLTWADKYVIGNSTIVVLSSVLCAAANAAGGTRVTDYYIVGSLVGLWVLVHIYFLCTRAAALMKRANELKLVTNDQSGVERRSVRETSRKASLVI